MCGACCVTCGMRCVEHECWLLSGCVGDDGMTCLGRVVLGHSNIKEGDGVVLFNLHGELDALVLLIDVLEELVEFLSAV